MNVQDSIANQQDSLSQGLAPLQLGPLFEPDPVKFSFETIGWPILGGLILVGLLIAFYFWLRSYKRNHYRREALKKLDSIRQADQTLEIFVVLKQAAMHAFGREKVGDLTGNDWLAFLEKTGKGVRILSQEDAIQTAIYKSVPLSVEAQHHILSNAKKWVRTHAV
ncbi:DUF4381 domain-containing protein [Algoriphagus chordae]|uniref:Uncharacterized protein DUF4381 n=1 Tax=Algoriphagus chordae TaxID=237019 RepID=A0A2W7QR60_9BACT|nr:DUF4381 domain-containing protein [Algoriphagus chordae]PZX48520.1 uncharacterized protein DUF4381 [Algoriphagus chordae]